VTESCRVFVRFRAPLQQEKTICMENQSREELLISWANGAGHLLLQGLIIPNVFRRFRHPYIGSCYFS
jgi:hypothetical protein